MAIQLPYTGGTTDETLPTPYTNGGGSIDLTLKEDKANKGVANGYAPLDANAKVPVANLPDTASLDAEVDGKITTHNSATTSVHGIANTANLVLTSDARLNTATNLANGLMSSTDKSKLDGVASGAEVNVNADWTAVSGDSQILNKPNSFAPTAHTHTKSEITDFTHTHAVVDVTGLQDALNGKQASGSYAPATGIAPSAITGTAVVTNDSRLNLATTSANGLMSSTDKSKLNGVASGAEVNVNADWNATGGDAQIINRPKVDTADLAIMVGIGGASVYNGNYRPYKTGNDIYYTGANDLGGGINPIIAYAINGVTARGSFGGLASTYTGWVIHGEEDVIAFFSDDAGRYDLPDGDFYTLPNGGGTLVVSIEEGGTSSGGEIITSGGGGTIDTRSFIQLGLAGSRTTIFNGGSANIVLPTASGTLALKSEIKNFYTAVTYTSNYTIALSSRAFPINSHFYFTVSGTPNQNEIIFPNSGYAGDIITVTNSSVKSNGSANSFNLTTNLPAGAYVSAFTDSLLAGTTRSYVFSNGWIRLSPAVPISVASAALIQPSLNGTAFSAPYTTTLTGTASRFLTQVSTSNRLQTVTARGERHNLGLVTAISNNGSLTFSNFRPTSDNPIAVIPLDTSSPTTGTTFITQKSNAAFTIANGSYYIATKIGGLLGPYSMTLADSNFTLQFSYDSAYLTWATANSITNDLIAGLALLPAGTLTAGTVFYVSPENILRIV